MYRYSFKISLLVIWLLLAGKDVAFSQDWNPKCRYQGLGVSLKSAYFMGDIPSKWNYMRPGLGISYTNRLNHRWSFLAELSAVRLMGNDASLSNPANKAMQFEYIRNLHFRNDVIQFQTLVQWDLFPNIGHYRKRSIYNIYAMAGVSGFYHNPQAKDSTGHWTNLRPLKTEGVAYSQWQVGIPAGIGVRYKLGIQWDLEVDLTYNITFTDYLDDVSGSYVDPSGLSAQGAYFSNRSGEGNDSFTGQPRDLNSLDQNVITDGNYQYASSQGPGTQRGSKKGFDSYVVMSVRLIWIIPQEKLMCPRY